MGRFLYDIPRTNKATGVEYCGSEYSHQGVSADQLQVHPPSLPRPPAHAPPHPGIGTCSLDVGQAGRLSPLCENGDRPSTFFLWRTNFKLQVCSGSNHPAETMPWMEEVEMANSVDDLNTSRPILGRQYQNFETLEARITTSLKRNIHRAHDPAVRVRSARLTSVETSSECLIVKRRSTLRSIRLKMKNDSYVAERSRSRSRKTSG